MLCFTAERCGSMIDFTWKLFSQTGNIDTYLLFKEIERENQNAADEQEQERVEIDYPIF
jgi:hypothetical protein